MIIVIILLIRLPVSFYISFFLLDYYISFFKNVCLYLLDIIYIYIYIYNIYESYIYI